MIATNVPRPTENAAIGKPATPLPSLELLEIGFCYARAVNDRYGLRLFANAVARKHQKGI